MRENYLTYRDFVFINKRFTKTRFNRVLLVFCGINSNGKNMVFGVSMIVKEDDDNFEYAMLNFKKALAEDHPPKLFIIERST